jgi:hypothetical protein
VGVARRRWFAGNDAPGLASLSRVPAHAGTRSHDAAQTYTSLGGEVPVSPPERP